MPLLPHHHIPEPPAPINLGEQPRICLIKLATLGDLLLTTPAIHALRERYPGARIDVLTTPGSAELLRDSQLIRHIYTLDKYNFDRPTQVIRNVRPALAAGAFLARLRRERYHAALLLHHLTLPFGRVKYQALLAAIAPRYSVGLDNGWGTFLDIRVPDKGFGFRHEADYCLAVVKALGAEVGPAAHPLRPTDLGWEDIHWSPDYSAPGPLIAMHAGSGSYSVARRWPVERYAQLAARLHQEYDARIVLLSGPEERLTERSLLARLGRPEWIEAYHTDSPHELARMLAHCALFIGNDSFPMHLATLAGVPTVAVFGPSNHHAWGPYRPDAPREVYVVRRNDLACSPCFYRGHFLGMPQGCPPRPCLTELPVERVLWPARRLLHQHGWRPTGAALLG
jgi:heptosyltransferase-2